MLGKRVFKVIGPRCVIKVLARDAHEAVRKAERFGCSIISVKMEK